MHHFRYQENELFCEDVAVAQIAAEVGTPFFLYSHATLKRHYKIFDDAFEGVDRLICYSAKANANMAMLRLFADLGGGLDIVSGGELYRGLKAGMKPERIVYSGVGKRRDEIDYALSAGILMFNVESLQELDLINARAGQLGKRAPIALRVNPDVDPKTHPYISTGLKKNKFGIDRETAIEGYKLARQMAHVDIVGIDCHIGSQITQTEPFADALKNLLELIATIRSMGIELKYLDMGGGLGITYDREAPPDPGEYARTIVETANDSGLRLILEPGRVIVGNAGVLVTEVLFRKSGAEKEFVIVDAGMNDLLRPTLYQAFHAIEPVRRPEAGRQPKTITADVVGPICESSDFLAADRQMPDAQPGDLLAVYSAGAYGFTMSSNYCSRLRVPEVMVRGARYAVVRARQQFEDLIAGESVPAFLSD